MHHSTASPAAEANGKPAPDFLVDLAILETALRRLTIFARHLSTGDLANPATRVHYYLLRARAVAREGLGRAGE